jgi:transcriptional regulator with XRE-family HTH domain
MKLNRVSSRKEWWDMRQNLRNARKRKGLTQRDIARLLNITVRQYGAIESGASNGSVKVWQEIKRVLGGTIDDLLQDD